MKRGKWKRHATRFFFEFLVVVSGVLVAYTINNASQVAKDRGAEEVLLSNINVDLKSDSISLNIMIGFNEKKILWIHDVINMIRSSGIGGDSIASRQLVGVFQFL